MAKYLKFMEDKDYTADTKFFDSDRPQLTITVGEIGMGLSEHDMPCFVCFEEPAVLGTRFQPCWKCQDLGWKVVKVDTRPFFTRFFSKYFTLVA